MTGPGVKQCIVFLSLVKMILATPQEAEWQLWKQQHGKVYQNDEQELLHSAIWTKNYQYIEKHNTGNHTFKLGSTREELSCNAVLCFAPDISHCHQLDMRGR